MTKQKERETEVQCGTCTWNMPIENLQDIILCDCPLSDHFQHALSVTHVGCLCGRPNTTPGRGN